MNMENSNRETIEVELAISKKKVVYFSYITAKELRESTGKKEDDSILVSDKIMKALVVSVDGATDKVLETLLDLPLADYQQVSSIMTVLISGALEEKKN
jgi:hypothetical protein